MGIVVFSSLREAFKNGFDVYDRTADGYLVRSRCAGRWALAIVISE
jgi:Ca2+-binding EF-hand superfamily protein